MPPLPNGKLSVWIGVDPGSSSGAIAVISYDGVVGTIVNTLTLKDRWEALVQLTRSGKAHAMLEKVHAMPKQGVSSTFAFGASFGELRAMLTAAGCPYEEVTPQKWQAAFGMKRKKDEGDTSWKNRLKAKAQQLFPTVKVTLATADALLLAEFCRRKRTGTL